MALSSPSSAAVKPAPAKSAAMPFPVTLSVGMPLQFVLTGTAALAAAVVCMAVRPDLLAGYHYGPGIVSLTHLFVLGWLATIIMGAMYQLVPVALETKLFSDNMAQAQWWLHAAGTAGMVWAFWKWDVKTAGQFGALVALGTGLFVFNIARTLGSIPRWNVVAFSIAAALFWLACGVLAGLGVTAARVVNYSPFPFLSQMHAHAHLGVAGFFVQMMIGVSYKLVPMFVLGEVQSPRRARVSIALLNAGLAGACVCILLQSRWLVAFAGLGAAGLAAYLAELAAILRARKRRQTDWGVRYFVTAAALLAPLGGMALVLSWPGLPVNRFTGQLETAYGFLALAGVLTPAILGMLYKIVPFLIWFGCYAREIGRAKVPALGDLYSTPWQIAGYWIYLAGLAAVLPSILFGSAEGIRWGSLVLLASLGAFAVNMAKMLRHLVRPRIEPLPLRPAVKTAL